VFLGLAAAPLFSPLLTKIGCRASRFVSKKEAPNEILKQNSADAFGKTIWASPQTSATDAQKFERTDGLGRLPSKFGQLECASKENL
jgi:hypothetical protein